MQKVGQVLDLYLYEAQTKNRLPQSSLQIDQGGVIGDKHYGKDPVRSVLLISKDSYTLAKDQAINLNPGMLGENILIDYNPYHLPMGTQLQIGSVILELAQNGTLCNGLTKIDSTLPKLLKKDRGIFAKVIKSGKINVSDTIYLLSTQEAS
jgi:MOSC domain-containing protein YiiM